jgi:hypothetical protein
VWAVSEQMLCSNMHGLSDRVYTLKGCLQEFSCFGCLF